MVTPVMDNAGPHPAGQHDRAPSVVEIVRSLAFYFAFYGVTVLLAGFAGLSAALSERALRHVVHGWTWWHRRCARIFLGIRVESQGFVPRRGVLYAIRHESFFEAIDLPCQYDCPVPFAKIELLRLPLWGPAGRRYGLIGVERDAGAKALRTMISAARKISASGRPLVIFPEGTRVRHGQSPALQAGFAGIYKMMGLPVIPVALDSGPLYHRFWKRSGTIHYRYGEEIPPGLPREELEARVHAAINALNHA